jgi:tRNA threonylcarbamoyladenosine biosynthesis protein TsaE
MIIEVPDIECLEHVISEHRHFFSQHKCYAFKGEMGVGKTTIIQKILRMYGVKELQGSPTYSIINEYQSNQGIDLYHLDCYRIKNDLEAFELGLEELLNKKNPIFIEWPEKVSAFLPPDAIWLRLNVSENHIRTIEIADEY